MRKSLARAFSDCVSANHALTLFPKFNKILFFILMPISLQELYVKKMTTKSTVLLHSKADVLVVTLLI